MGVNDDLLKPEHRIVSNASCTAHCAAPVIKILHEAFGIRKALFLTTVHAYTNQDRSGRRAVRADPRRGRAAAENIIPQETNSAEVVMGLIPSFEGRITGDGDERARARRFRRRPGLLARSTGDRDGDQRGHANRCGRPTGRASSTTRTIRSSPPTSSCTGYSSTFDSLATMVLGDRSPRRSPGTTTAGATPTGSST